jgi:hypothetical protein
MCPAYPRSGQDHQDPPGRGSNNLREPGGRGGSGVPGRAVPVLRVQELGEPRGVDLGVVALAVVEQHMGAGGVPGQGAHLGCPPRQLGLGVAVAEPLVDVLAVPPVRVPMHADDGQAG